MAAIVAGRLLGRPVVLKIVGDNAWELALRRGWTTAGIDEFQRLPVGPHVRLVRGLVRQFARLVTKLIVPSDYLETPRDRLGRLARQRRSHQKRARS